MAILFYNKPLLRFMVAIIGLATILAGWHYVSLSVRKLPEHGAIDALAIISFMIAGWLVMVIAEVLDHHYVRVLGCFAMLLGAVVAYKWIFITDGPKLAQVEGGAAGMGQLSAAYYTAAGVTVLMLAMLITRLVLDKQNLGRPLAKIQPEAEIEGAIPLQVQEERQSTELPPIPVDVSPINTTAEQAAPEEPRKMQAVSKLVGISGVYLGVEFELKPGQMSVGRRECDILLENDNQVSKTHARLDISDEMMAEITDLESTNGTFLNNSQVQYSSITVGDVIRVGTTMFRVEA